MNKVTYKIVLDTKSKEAAKRLYLQVTWNRQAYKYSLGLNDKLTKEQFNNKRLAVTKDAMDKAMPLLTKADSIIRELGDSFSFDKFKNKWKGLDEQEIAMTSDLIDVYEHYIKDNSISASTIDSYKTAVNRVCQYKKQKVIDWNTKYIEGFVRELESEGKSSATIGMYLRSLRTLYNYASKSFKVEPDIFRGLKIAKTISKNKVLSDFELKKLLDYSPISEKEAFAKDMFLISFGLGGANFADILLLKNEQIEGNKVTYVREKTKNRVKSSEPIHIEVDAQTMERIEKYGHLNASQPKGYVFPYIKQGMTERQILSARKDVVKKINKGLKSIEKELSVENLTTYVARHTVTTMLINHGIPVSHISQVLGHTNITTTQNYIGRLSEANQHAISGAVSSFLGAVEGQDKA